MEEEGVTVGSGDRLGGGGRRRGAEERWGEGEFFEGWSFHDCIWN